MKTYEELIGKKVDLMFNQDKINTFVITSILSTDQESIDGRGIIYNCSLNWENKNKSGDYPYLSFEARTLEELIEKKMAICPYMPNIYYVLTN